MLQQTERGVFRVTVQWRESFYRFWWVTVAEVLRGIGADDGYGGLSFTYLFIFRFHYIINSIPFIFPLHLIIFISPPNSYFTEFRTSDCHRSVGIG